MRVAAMAAGAVGAYFGARMAAAGHDVFFIARGAHRDAMRKNGLRIESVNGDLHLPKPTSPTIRPAVGPVDAVLFAVKLWDTEKGRRGGAAHCSGPTPASSRCRTASTATSASRRSSARNAPSPASLMSSP